MTEYHAFKKVIDTIKLNYGYNQKEVVEKLGYSSVSNLSEIISGKSPITDAYLQKLSEVFNVNIDFVRSRGVGSVFNSLNQNERSGENRNLIPFYDDVVSVGGREVTAYVDGLSGPAEYVNAGDWFVDVTAAIRHYGDSMVEYPSGCILAIKEVRNKDLIVPGLDYSIETIAAALGHSIGNPVTSIYINGA